MRIHEYARYFPILEGEEFQLLVEDIKKNGQLEPIITIDGRILDGVNRYRACQELGIDPKVEEYVGDDPLGFVVSINVRRRHLDASQRAMLATEMLPEFEKLAKERKIEKAKNQRPEGSTKFMSSSNDFEEQNEKKDHNATDDAGKLFGVSGRLVQQAKRIKKEAPEKVEDIISGKETVSSVDREILEKRAKKRYEEEQEKQDKKIPKEHPKAVKEFFDSVKIFKDSIKFAIKIAKQGMFSPESKQFVENQYSKIIELMNELLEEMK